MVILKFSYILLFHVLCVSLFTFEESQKILHISQTDPEKAFEAFITTFNKSYTKDSLEYNQRFCNFQETVKRIKALGTDSVGTAQHDNNTAVYGINKFSDLTSSEFKEIYLTAFVTDSNTAPSAESTSWTRNIQHSDFPKHFDWRDKGVVTPVRNQGQCGSCWAFSVTETIESKWAMSGHGLVELSPQQLVDCSKNHGCKGGSPGATLAWIKQNNVKLVKNSVYPYKDRQGRCYNESLDTFGVGVTGYFFHKCWKSCSPLEMDKMLPTLLHVGPISVLVDAASWQDYISGIIQHHCSANRPNHAVQLVGYNLPGIPHWIVRNSWGKDFGDAGYLYIKIGENLCGVANSYCGASSVKGFHEAPQRT